MYSLTNNYKMIKIKVLLAVVALCAGFVSVNAQVKSNKVYLLPDGKVIGEDKLDSIKTAWGDDRVIKVLTDELNPDTIKLKYLSDEELAMLKGQIKEIPDNAFLNSSALDFNLTDLDGKMVTLSELKGKVVVLNFWFTMCKPCIQEMPDLNKLTEKYRDDKDVIFLGITFNKADDVKKFLTKHEFKYRQIPDASELLKEYNMSIFPHNVVVDKNGIIKYFNGGTDENIGMILSSIIESLK